jgi:hypothetical protein
MRNPNKVESFHGVLTFPISSFVDRILRMSAAWFDIPFSQTLMVFTFSLIVAMQFSDLIILGSKNFVTVRSDLAGQT